MKSAFLRVLTIIVALALPLAGQEKAAIGPDTEKRFPPLQVPAGFRATLFACDPLIEYPSALAAGPRPNSLFVAVDYMTGLGSDIVRRDEVRLLEDTNGDGYADQAPVFAEGFNSIMGLAYHDDTLFVMHAPYLSAVRKTKDGKVTRTDLLTGLGLTPEKNPVRLHCANGVTVGHDGWLYLAMGDNGVDVQRPEGDRLVLNGGGILRCRPDGKDLHVFATGLRNIYDVAIDEDLNAFVRDNENDGGTYKIRVCHSFFGADHGYPYLYYERPDEAMPPLADLGLGSSAGAICYLEQQFPPAYRGRLFCCEWGRSLVQYGPTRAGSGFATVKEVEFAAGAAKDPYGFKPTDLAVGRDGALYAADWADGQRPKRGRGRIYRISADAKPVSLRVVPAELPQVVERLDSASYYERTDAQAVLQARGADGLFAVRAALAAGKIGVRARLHAVWLLASGPRAGAVAELLDLLRRDAEPRVQVQAVRAIADLSDPVLVRHRLDAASGDGELAATLAKLAVGKDPMVVREIITALGRLGWPSTPEWLPTLLDRPDAALLHAAQQALRRVGNWPATVKLLDHPRPTLQELALRAMSDRHDAVIVDGLLERLPKEIIPLWRQRYGDALARVHRRPGPWAYWGYRPGPRPAGTVNWERTEAIERALDRLLQDADLPLRLAILQRMRREQVPTRLDTLARWLGEERAADRVTALLEALAQHPAAASRAALSQVIREKDQSEANRLRAFTQFMSGLDAATEGQLLAVLAGLEDDAVLAEAIQQTRKRPQITTNAFLVGKLKSAQPAVRAAALDALADRQAAEARDLVAALLDDAEPLVRRSAAAAAGTLAPASADRLLALTRDADAQVRRASLDSLRRLKDRRVVPLAVAALTDSATELVALRCLGELADAGQAKPVIELARRNPSIDIQAGAARVLTDWNHANLPAEQRRDLDRAVAQLQGASGNLIRWRTAGPLTVAVANAAVERFKAGQSPETPDWKTAFAAGTESRLKLGKVTDAQARTWLLHCELEVAQETAIEFLGSGGGDFQVFFNGQSIHSRAPRAFQVDSDRFAATLAAGNNRLLVTLTPTQGEADFHLRFRRKSSAAEHEALTQAALGRRGNLERGRQLFLNAEKSQCVKCHRLLDQGERIGPELTGIGSRFSPVHIVESILEPSRTIAPSFESTSLTLKNGKILIGVRVEETGGNLTLADNQGQKHVILKADIDERQAIPTSTMPDGLEKRLTLDEFVDLITFLVNQKQIRD